MGVAVAVAVTSFATAAGEPDIFLSGQSVSEFPGISERRGGAGEWGMRTAEGAGGRKSLREHRRGAATPRGWRVGGSPD
jgi:hypothetical protein